MRRTRTAIAAAPITAALLCLPFLARESPMEWFAGMDRNLPETKEP